MLMEFVQIAFILQNNVSIIMNQQLSENNCVHVLHNNVSWSDHLLGQLKKPIILSQEPQKYNQCGQLMIFSYMLNLTSFPKLPYHSKGLIIHDNYSIKIATDTIIKKLFSERINHVSFLYINGSNYEFTASNNGKWSPKMRNQTLRIALFPYEPMVFYNNEEGLYNGIEKHILHPIIHDWDVTFNVHPENTWEKIINDIVNGTADIGLCGYWRDSVNDTVTDMTKYYAQTCSTFLVHKPILVPITATYILESFNYTVYIIIIITIIIVAYLLKLFDNHSSYFTNFLIIYQLTVFVSPGRQPKQFTLKCLIGSWCLTAILINVFYGAGLTIRLSIPVFTPPVNTFADMYNQKVNWLLKSPNIWQYINSSDNYYKQQLTTLVSGKQLTNTTADVINMMHATNVNIISKYLDVPDEEIKNLSQQAKPLTECLLNSYFVFPMQKNSPFKKIFDEEIEKMVEAGLIQQWFNMIFYKSLNWLPLLYQTYPNYDNTIQLNILHLQGALIVLGVGYIFSLIIFITELMHH